MASKKLQELMDLIRARQNARGPALPASAERPSVDSFLRSYGDLTRATVELYRKLDDEDPLMGRVREVLVQAQQALAPVFADTAASQQPDASGRKPSTEPARLSTSLELVHAPTRSPLVQAPLPRSRYPDEAAIVRYVRHRRATGPHYPDEAVLGRYLRHRRQTGPHYPNEAAIARYLRKRRELYALGV